jgi:acyl-CoA dehydrogenase
MSPPSAADLNHPAFARIPPWVQQKLSPKAVETIKKVHHWVERECVPAEPIVKAQLEKNGRWKMAPLMKELREKSKKEGLFNLFLPKTFGDLSPGLTNLEYSCCAEIMGRVYWGAMVGQQPHAILEDVLIIGIDNELSRPRYW